MFYLVLVITIAVVYWIVQKFPLRTAALMANVAAAMPFVWDDVMDIVGGVDYSQFMSAAQASLMGVLIALLNVFLRYKYGEQPEGAMK